MTKKFTLSHLRLCFLLALSCITWHNSNAQACGTFAGCFNEYAVQSTKLTTLNYTYTPGTCQVYNYLTDTAKMCLGAIDTMTVGITAHGQIGIGVFIDTNRDGIYEGNEFIYVATDTSVSSYSVPINILPTTHSGTYNMVIYLGTQSYQFTSNDSCASSSTMFGSSVQFRIQVLDSVKITTQPVSVNGCINNPVSFHVGTAGLSVTYQWFKDSTAIAGATGPTYNIGSFQASDTDYYYAVVTNPCAIATSDTVTLTIHPAPPVSVAVTGPTAFCPGGKVALVGNTAVGYTYKWLYNGVPTSDTTHTDTVSLPGAYSYVVFNGCPDTAAAVNITNFPTLPPTISPAGLTKKCATLGQTDTFTTTPNSGVTYQWQINTGVPNVYVNIPSATLPYLIANTTGYYVLVVTDDSNHCITRSPASTFQENTPATVNVSTLASPYLCAGGYITLLASSSDTGEKFRWQFNGSPITPASGARGSTYNAYQAGNYSVVGDNGCSVTSAAITLYTIPSPSVIAAGPSTFCGSGSVLLSSNVTSTDVTYQWQKNGVDIPGATGTTYTASDSGNYSVVIISNNTCTAGSTPITVTIYPIPVPVIALGTDNLTLTVSPFFHKYQWYFNGNPVPAPAGTHASLEADSAGYYTVAVTDDNGCTATSGQVYAPGKVTGISNVNAASVSIYPNPASAVVRVNAPVAVNAIITALDGRTVLQQTAAKDINIAQLADGIYMLRITDANGNMIKIEKLVKSSK